MTGQYLLLHDQQGLVDAGEAGGGSFRTAALSPRAAALTEDSRFRDLCAVLETRGALPDTMDCTASDARGILRVSPWNGGLLAARSYRVEKRQGDGGAVTFTHGYFLTDGERASLLGGPEVLTDQSRFYRYSGADHGDLVPPDDALDLLAGDRTALPDTLWEDLGFDEDRFAALVSALCDRTAGGGLTVLVIPTTAAGARGSLAGEQLIAALYALLPDCVGEALGCVSCWDAGPEAPGLEGIGLAVIPPDAVPLWQGKDVALLDLTSGEQRNIGPDRTLGRVLWQYRRDRAGVAAFRGWLAAYFEDHPELTDRDAESLDRATALYEPAPVTRPAAAVLPETETSEDAAEASVPADIAEPLPEAVFETEAEDAVVVPEDGAEQTAPEPAEAGEETESPEELEAAEETEAPAGEWTGFPAVETEPEAPLPEAPKAIADGDLFDGAEASDAEETDLPDAEASDEEEDLDGEDDSDDDEGPGEAPDDAESDEDEFDDEDPDESDGGDEDEPDEAGDDDSDEETDAADDDEAGDEEELIFETPEEMAESETAAAVAELTEAERLEAERQRLMEPDSAAAMPELLAFLETVPRTPMADRMGLVNLYGARQSSSREMRTFFEDLAGTPYFYMYYFGFLAGDKLAEAEVLETLILQRPDWCTELCQAATEARDIFPDSEGLLRRAFQRLWERQPADSAADLLHLAAEQESRLESRQYAGLYSPAEDLMQGVGQRLMTQFSTPEGMRDMLTLESADLAQLSVWSRTYHWSGSPLRLLPLCRTLDTVKDLNDLTKVTEGLRALTPEERQLMLPRLEKAARGPEPDLRSRGSEKQVTVRSGLYLLAAQVREEQKTEWDENGMDAVAVWLNALFARDGRGEPKKAMRYLLGGLQSIPQADLGGPYPAALRRGAATFMASRVPDKSWREALLDSTVLKLYKSLPEAELKRTMSRAVHSSPDARLCKAYQLHHESRGVNLAVGSGGGTGGTAGLGPRLKEGLLAYVAVLVLILVDTLIVRALWRHSPALGVIVGILLCCVVLAAGVIVLKKRPKKKKGAER